MFFLQNFNLKIETMTWNINFCAPFLPTDPTINFHRQIQTGALTFYLIMYALVHIYYQFFAPLPIEETMDKEAKEKKNKQDHSEQDEEQNSENISQDKDKVSLKLEEQANQSCVSLKKTGSTWNPTRDGSNISKSFIQNVTLEQVKQYFPVIFGHFAVAMGMSIMYTPYAEQTIAALLYIILTVILLITNAKRHNKTTMFIWGVMTVIIMFLMTCGLLEVGQSNWDIINQTCFANQYISLYD